MKRILHAYTGFLVFLFCFFPLISSSVIPAYAVEEDTLVFQFDAMYLEPIGKTFAVHDFVTEYQNKADMGGNTSVRNVSSGELKWKKQGYYQRNRDLGQLFIPKNYFSLGYRWGMGIDASEIRLGEYRFLSLWDKTNNWMAENNLPPKFALAISEARSDKGYRGRPPTDDAYGMSPVNYLRLEKVPSVDDMSPITKALKEGRYFVTSGEVLIPEFEVQGTGTKRTIVAEVEWTFPLEFVEVVWGDGETIDRQIIAATEQLPFGKKRFEIPFDAANKKWVRFAAWDVATNGAMVQPVNLMESQQN